MSFESVRAYLSELNMVSMILRLLLAIICGGIIGIERGSKRRPAGLRTHILVCIGSTLVMMVGQYAAIIYGTSDPTRMAAQVISGIGFLGAGTIIVTGRQQVRGLTTAAGLWACACMGLAIGIGFYEGAVLGCLSIFLVITLLHRFHDKLQISSKVMSLYLEFVSNHGVTEFVSLMKEQGIHISEIQISRGEMEKNSIVLATVNLGQRRDHSDIMAMIGELSGVTFVEEM